MTDATQVDLKSLSPKKRKISKAKILIIALSTIIFLPIVVVISVPIFFNANDFKPQISGFFKELTGRDLTINGDISISFFPWLGLKVDAIVLSNTPEFDSEPFARIARSNLKIKLLPLLFDQQFELDKISLSGFQLFLTRNKQGRSNWEGLISDDVAEDATSDSSTNFDNLEINGLNIENAQVIWRDRTLGQQYEISNISISTGVLAWEQPVNLHFAAEVALNDPAMTAQIELETRIEYDVDAARYNFNISKLQTELKGAMFPNNSVDLNLSSDVDIDVVQQKIKLTDIIIDSYESKLQGNLKIANFQDQLTVDGKFNLKQSQTTTDDKGEISLALKSLKSSEVEKVFQLAGNVNMIGINVRSLMHKLNHPLPQMGKNDTFEDVDMNLDLNISNNKIELSNMALNADQARLSGDLAIQLGAAIPEIVADLTVDYLVIEDYFPSESGLKKNNKPMLFSRQHPKKSEKNAPLLTTILPELPTDKLRNLNADVTLKLKKSSVFGVSFENSELTLQAKQGNIQLSFFGVEQSATKLNGTIQLDAQAIKPKISAKLDIRGLNLRKLMSQFGIVLSETKNPNTFERFDLSTELSMDSTDLEFTKLLLKLDDMTLKGMLNIHAGEQPVIDAKLTVDRLNLDDYFFSDTEKNFELTKKEKIDLKKAEVQNKESFPLSDLRRVKLDLALRIDELQAYNLKVSKVKIDLLGEKGLFRAYPLRGDFYGGVYEGKLFADFRSEQPKYKMDDQLKNIQLGPLFDDLDELDDIDKKKGKKSTTGTASAKWQLAFEGEGAQGFSGQSQFEIRDGATYKVSLSKVILNSLKGSMTKSKSSKQDAIETTEFSRLAASIKIKNGIIQNEDFFLESEGIKATGSGKIDLVTSQVDYLIKANVVTGRGLLKLVEGRYIPIKVKGNLSSLSYYPDIGGGLSSITGNVKKGVSQLGENIKGVLGVP